MWSMNFIDNQASGHQVNKYHSDYLYHYLSPQDVTPTLFNQNNSIKLHNTTNYIGLDKDHTYYWD
jgi:hypothetical protein